MSDGRAARAAKLLDELNNELIRLTGLNAEERATALDRVRSLDVQTWGNVDEG